MIDRTASRRAYVRRAWTNDLMPSMVGNAWVVEFGDGSVLTDTRDTTCNARAVR